MPARALRGPGRVTRSLGWTGGSIASKINMSAGSVGNIDGPDTEQFNGLINNRGSVSLGPDAGLVLVSGTNVNNYGTFTAQHGARISGSTCCVTPAVINNTGTFRVTSGLIPLPGTDTVTVKNASFNAGGIVNVSSGVLELRSAPGKIAASTKFTGDGTVKIIDNADLTMLGSFSVAPSTDIELGSCEGQCGGGSLLGTGSMTGDGRFLWSGGTVAGDLTLGPQIDTRISGPTTKSIEGGKITNLGSALMPAGAAGGPPARVLNLGSNDKFVNQGIFSRWTTSCSKTVGPPGWRPASSASAPAATASSRARHNS